MKKIILVMADFFAIFWKLVPQKIRHIPLLSLVLLESRGRDPRKNLKSLFSLKDKLEWAINTAALDLGNGVHPKHQLIGYHNFFISRINDGESVLDIGCGYGAVATSIANAKPNSRIVGIDNNESRLKQAKENNVLKNLSYENCDAIVKVPEGPWDVVVLSNVLEHIDERSNFLEQIIQVTGCSKYLIRVPNFERDWQVAMRKQLGVYYYSDDDHRIEHTVKEFKDEISSAGLSIAYLNTTWGEIWADCFLKNDQ